MEGVAGYNAIAGFGQRHWTDQYPNGYRPALLNSSLTGTGARNRLLSLPKTTAQRRGHADGPSSSAPPVCLPTYAPTDGCR
ncbi:hypothetical protein MJ584_21930 [Klebsiella pneumoniae]|nr:hypothetical protein MJ584_21930 [Klebsiella pneumoniae]